MVCVISAINKTLWGTPMLLLLFGCGVYLTVRLGFFQLFGIREWMRESIGSVLKKKERKDGGISPYRALSAALGATIGSGNIVGVATAVASGGAGAVFWMWVSAFFGMATKYAEIYLAVRFRGKSGGEFFGGPMYYIEKGLGKKWRWLACAFAVSGAFACMGMGAMNQANTVSAIVTKRLNFPGVLVGGMLAIITGFAINGGIKKVSGITQTLVPIMALFYVGAGLFVMVSDPGNTARAFSGIFRAAFSKDAFFGGASGMMAKQAVRYGVARGVFSNEAGLGSSPIIHATADAKSPKTQGFWGVFEVFADTFVICTITAVVILTAEAEGNLLTGAELVSSAFSMHMGGAGIVFVEISTILFAVSTILGWSYYGERCVCYLIRDGEDVKRAYRVLFSLAVFLGSILNVGIVWELSDLFNGMMMVPNLIAVILLSDIVIKNK